MKINDFSTPEKEFCCLKMKEVLQARVYEETKNMTTEEVLTYFNMPTDQPFFMWLRKEQNNK